MLKLGDFVAEKLFGKFKNEFSNLYDSLNETNLQMLITSFMYHNPEKTQEKILNWMEKKVWKKIENGKQVKELKLGNILSHFGEVEMDYELRSQNETTIKREISVVSSISRKTFLLSKNSFLKTLKYIILCINHEKTSVVNVAINAFSLFLQGLNFSCKGFTHKSLIKKGIRNGENIEKIKFNFPEEQESERYQELIEGLLILTFETVEEYMKKILGVDEIQGTEYDESVLDIYKHSIKQEGQDENLDHLNNPLIDSLCDSVQVLNGIIGHGYFFKVIFRDRKFVQFLKTFKKKMVSFLKQSKLFELEKVKSSLLFFLTYEAFHVEDYIDMNKALSKQITHTFSFCSSHLFKSLPPRKQFNSVFQIGKNILRIENLISGSKRAQPTIFSESVKKNPYLSEIQDFQLKTSDEENFFFFSDLVQDYLIKDTVNQSFYQLAPLVLRHNSNQANYKFLENLMHVGPFFLRENITLKTYDTCSELLKFKCSINTDYNDIVNNVTYQLINYFSQPIKNFEMKKKFLEILKLTAENADSNKCFTKFKKNVVLLCDMAPIFEVTENSKIEFLEKISKIKIFLKEESAISFFVFVSDFLSEIGSYKNDLEVLKSAVLTLSRNLNVKDIRKRILVSLSLIYTQSIIEKKNLRNKDLIISCDSLADDEGLIGVKIMKEIYKEIKHKLGYRKEGSKIEKIQKEFESLTPEYLPLDSDSYGRTPFKYQKIEAVEKKFLKFSENEIQEITEIYKDYLKGIIVESENMKANEYNSLSINQSLIHEILKFKSSIKSTCKNTTLFFRRVTSSILQNFGSEIYENIKGVFSEQKTESKENISSVKRFEQEFYASSLNTASLYFSEEEFEKVAEDTIQVYKSYMTPLHRNIKLTVSYRLAAGMSHYVNSEKFLKVFNILNKIFLTVSEPESRSMMLSLYGSLFWISSVMFDEETENILKEAIEKEELKTLNSYKEIGSLLIVLQQTSISTSYSLKKIKKFAENLTVESLYKKASETNDVIYCEISRSENFNPLKISIEFLKMAEKQSILTRLSVLKTFLLAVMRSSKFYVNNETSELALSLLKLAISMDSNESEEAKALVSGAQLYLPKVFTGFLIDEKIKEEFFEKCEGHYPEIKGAKEKKRLFVKGYSILCETDFNEKRIDFLATILGGFNNLTSEKTSEDLLYSIERTCAADLLRFTKYINSKLDKIEKV